MSKFLVTYASKMGSTREIAEVIGAELLAAGHQVDVMPAEQVYGVGRYNGIVLGSAVYAGRWRREAVKFLKRHADALSYKHVWLFQSGPCGDEAAKGAATDKDEARLPGNVARLAEQIGVTRLAEQTGTARLAEQTSTAPVVTFGGRLEPASARGFLAKRMATGPLAGDYRDWDRIREWARTVSAQYAPHA